MKKLLILALLVVGCEEAGITTNGLTDGTAVTDTLYISYDTTYTVYDTLIVSFDTTITYNYDTTIYVYDTLIVLDTLIINYDTTITVMDTVFMVENSEYIDVDWMLIKYAQMQVEGCSQEADYIETGYKLITHNASGIIVDDDIVENNDGVLSFIYNEETFTYDLSDSSIPASVGCSIQWNFRLLNQIDGQGFDKIIINNELEFCLLFWDADGFEGGQINPLIYSTPNQLINL